MFVYAGQIDNIEARQAFIGEMGRTVLQAWAGIRSFFPKDRKSVREIVPHLILRRREMSSSREFVMGPVGLEPTANGL
jgi:hypothetical protein